MALHDRWDNEAGLAGKTLDDIQVVIRRERPGELVRAQQRRDLLGRLWRTENELATAERAQLLRKARESNAAKHRGDLLLFKQKLKAQAAASSAEAQKALQGETKIELEATTKRAEVEELRALDAALTSDPDWQLDNAEEQLKSAENVRVSVALNPLSGFTVEYTIDKPTSDDTDASTGQYVIVIKLHGEHIASSPASVMCWGESLFTASALPAFAFAPPTATGSSPHNQSGLLAGTTTAPRRKDRAGGRKSRSTAAAVEESTSLSFSLLSLNGPGPTPDATLSMSPPSSSSPASPFSYPAAPPSPSTSASSSSPASPFSFSTMPLTPTSASSSSPASQFSFTAPATLAPGEPTAHFSFSSPSLFASSSSSPFAPATPTPTSSSSSSSSSSPSPSVFAFGSPTPSEPANLE